jgi:hypothetical protein
MNNEKKQKKNILNGASDGETRGRKRFVQPNWVLGAAENYNTQFSIAWERMGEQLLAAKSPEEVLNALNASNGQISIPIDPSQFASLILEIMNEPTFPKVRMKSQIRFLSDSLGANGVLTARRSRDVCAEERAKAKETHHILRYEYFVECSCGYKGHSENHACASCRAPIYLDVFTGM